MAKDAGESRRAGAAIAFCERFEPTSESIEDLDTARMITRIQAGDRDAFRELYSRFFDRVYAYVRVALRDHHEAEDTTQQVFIRVMGAIPRYELRAGKPFRAWLFRIARNEVLSQVRKRGRVEVEDPNDIDRRRDDPDSPPDVSVLNWITDQDLTLFVERLPDAQRQALTLRHMLGLSTEEIATVLERTPVAIRKLEHRALRFLESRLAAVGRTPSRSRRAPTLIRMRRVPVLRARRFALGSKGAAPARRGSFRRA
jgi:RNA polymerase sigma-70 factor (ECF subfamily)